MIVKSCLAGGWKKNTQLPIVYHPDYNVSFFGLEKLHPFDSCKFQKVVAGLKSNKVIDGMEQLVQPLAVSQDTLLQVHSQQYLSELNKSSIKVAQVFTALPKVVPTGRFQPYHPSAA